MSLLSKMLSGIGILIAIYLFLSRGKDTVAIINTIASNATQGIKTLQGR
jgi:hypothetical protein